MDDDTNVSWNDWKDDEREMGRRVRRRILLDARGTTKQHFEPDAGRDELTERAFEILRRGGLL